MARRGRGNVRIKRSAMLGAVEKEKHRLRTTKVENTTIDDDDNLDNINYFMSNIEESKSKSPIFEKSDRASFIAKMIIILSFVALIVAMFLQGLEG